MPASQNPSRLEPVRVLVVFEAGELSQESQRDWANRSVSLLEDIDFRRSFVRRLGVVNLIAINGKNDIGVLLDGAGFPQIGHLWPLVRPLLQRSIELR